MSAPTHPMPTPPDADAGGPSGDAKTSRQPWHKPQMWLLDYAETSSTVHSQMGDSESTGYGATS